MATQEIEIKIVWTRRATRHLRAAYEYWTKEKSEQAADLMLDRIFSAVELIGDHPRMGRPGRVGTTREFVLLPLPFVLAYRHSRRKVEVLALLHGARKWPSNFD
jgi:toxin ParE1/3/4